MTLLDAITLIEAWTGYSSFSRPTATFVSKKLPGGQNALQASGAFHCILPTRHQLNVHTCGPKKPRWRSAHENDEMNS
jgi:hypothetical protein